MATSGGIFRGHGVTEVTQIAGFRMSYGSCDTCEILRATSFLSEDFFPLFRGSTICPLYGSWWCLISSWWVHCCGIPSSDFLSSTGDKLIDVVPRFESWPKSCGFTIHWVLQWAPWRSSGSGPIWPQRDRECLEKSRLAYHARLCVTLFGVVYWSVRGLIFNGPVRLLSGSSWSANIGNAKVLGLAQSLHLTDNQYNLALSIFFVGYVIYETPSNIILKRTSPRYYIPFMTVSHLTLSFSEWRNTRLSNDRSFGV